MCHMKMNLVVHISEDVYEIEYYYEEKKENKKNSQIRTAKASLEL